MYGTLSTLDTLRTNYQSVAEFGEDRAFDSINALLEAHNRIMNSMFDDLCERTTDRLRRYGTTDSMVMTKGNEFSRPDVQKIAPGAVAGFPLELWEMALQWTKKWFQVKTVAELAGQFVALRTADIIRQVTEIKRSIFVPTNYTFDDYLLDHLQNLPLPVRAFLNADGLGVPAGPNGELFNGSSHTHYFANGTPANADVVTLLETVLEHYTSGEAVIYINRAQEGFVRGLSGFTPYLNAGLVGPTTSTQFPGRSLSAVPLYNRAIGQFNGAEVWVKPWMPASYLFAFLRDQPKPLVYRYRPGTDMLAMVADDEKHPLRAKSFEREFGVGVWNRTNGAVLYVGGNSYTAPTLPSIT